MLNCAPRAVLREPACRAGINTALARIDHSRTAFFVTEEHQVV